MWTRISTFDREKVEIWYRQNWHPVHAYLKHLRPAIDWNFASSDFTAETQLRRSQQQQRWWAANGKVFRFLDLPAEIRELVYEYAIGPKVEPYPTARTRKLGTNGCAALVARMPNASLLLTNKLVYEEASDVLFRRTRFYVDQLGVLAKLLRNEEQSARIRRLGKILHFRVLIEGTRGPKVLSYPLTNSNRACTQSSRILQTLWHALQR